MSNGLFVTVAVTCSVGGAAREKSESDIDELVALEKTKTVILGWMAMMSNRVPTELLE